MSDGQSWLIPRGADGGEFKWEVKFLQSIARPLEESTDAARKIAKERAQAGFDLASLAGEDKTGASEVTGAVNDFLDKWCHGLGCIADDADVIVSALSATINDFLVAETKARYKVMMLERQEQYEKDHPVSTFLEKHGITEERTEFRGRLEPVDRDGQDQK
ncbi:hypothetical protein [Streptomyces calvus]|jgi:hypothetical protein|uniref:Uncharacterized protein n=1 Tax=Streptomyces calvus TaxID=67282 RepID=A0A514JPJ0_9ACTN|nr:hypothetical protein [Streptomyces calvus]MBA8944761.1 hypothetical protein [Streptomyces calvus]QDI68708.1 hypothetical protein CD934_08445 [Streptomyces calvus]GGP66871.1 hypothetical protein GCM10010247_44650 [Streptomyces calvus]